MLDKARWAPQSLVRFALDQVKDAVIDGTGPLRSGKKLEPGRVCEVDVDLMRRILYSFGGDGNIAVTRPEAEVLFDIDEATAEADNHPAWTDLFVKAIASCVMAASGYAGPPREIALARDAWLDRRGDLSLDAMLGGMGAGLNGLFGGYREQTEEEQAIARLTQQKIEIVTHEAVTTAEAAWLAERIGKDGKLTPNERALLDLPEGGEPVHRPGAAAAAGARDGGGVMFADAESAWVWDGWTYGFGGSRCKISATWSASLSIFASTLAI